MAQHPQTASPSSGPIKMALILTFLAAAIWAVCWWAAFLIIGDPGASYLWLHFGIVGTKIGTLGLMCAWLLLRSVDFAAGGATFRSSFQTAHSIEVGLASSVRAIAKAFHHPVPMRPTQFLDG